MKSLHKPIILILFLIAGLVLAVGCGEPEPTQQPDVPSMSENEACAVVYDSLQSYVNELKTLLRISVQQTLNKARPSFHAVYIGKGQWEVKALGYGYLTADEKWYYYYTGGTWNVYETTGIVEPGNTKARNILEHWQRYKE